MATDYELIDLASGNLVGTYDSRDAVVAVIRRSLDQHGVESVVGLARSEVDDAGNDELAASGFDVIRYLLPEEAMSHEPSADAATSGVADLVLPRTRFTN